MFHKNTLLKLESILAALEGREESQWDHTKWLRLQVVQSVASFVHKMRLSLPTGGGKVPDTGNI